MHSSHYYQDQHLQSTFVPSTCADSSMGHTTSYLGQCRGDELPDSSAMPSACTCLPSENALRNHLPTYLPKATNRASHQHPLLARGVAGAALWHWPGQYETRFSGAEERRASLGKSNGAAGHAASFSKPNQRPSLLLSLPICPFVLLPPSSRHFRIFCFYTSHRDSPLQTASFSCSCVAVGARSAATLLRNRLLLPWTPCPLPVL